MALESLKQQIKNLENQLRLEKNKSEKYRLRLIQARHDRVSGANSEFAFSQDLSRNINAMKKYSGAVMFIDLNNLHNANKVFGYSIGNGLLQRLASTVGEHITSKTKFYRHGGDEFLLVMKDTDYRTSEKIGRTIMLDFQEYCNKFYNYRITRPKLRIGISWGSAAGTDFLALIDIASERMKKRKKRIKGNAR